ncbi:uncharacterized protein LTR77_005265 [Saxophila tyrrhenica]|uniref:Xylanolytic transcriptional activator regulatory domain-containing protein n=1 Tax=Saxophila tyrrhenica TaxID=1690608 RepID=A0AAV9PEP1_9PEZI|nr:hypothetical protein LTR77_005265 [Saxophila tyrrhenica]
MQELLACLPPQKACRELVSTYFSSFASLFHILHDPTFQRQYSYFLEDPHSMPLAWIALLYSLLATAILALPPDSELLSDLSRKKTPLEMSAELTQRYRDMAVRCLEADHYLWNHSVTTLQALVILIYGINHSHGQTWTLIGLAHHLALGIGCHVDPKTLGLGAVESEERRRCWAGLMMLYTNQNTALGHIAMPHTALYATSRPPADANDEDIGANGPRPTQMRRKATQMTYLLLKFRLYDLCAEICDGVLRKKTPNVDVVREIDKVLQEERRSWEARLLEAADTGPMPVHHSAHLNILYSYSNHLTLLLHQRQALDPSFDPATAQWARNRCLEGAKHLLEVHAALNEAPELSPFRWYGRGLGSFHAFHAATLLTHLLRIQFAQEETSDCVNLLKRCLRRFESLAEYSAVCTKALPVLQALVHSLPAQAEETRLSGPKETSQQPHSLSAMLPRQGQPYQALPTYHGQAHNAMHDTTCYDLNALLWRSPPQQWLTPANLPWADWTDAAHNHMMPILG